MRLPYLWNTLITIAVLSIGGSPVLAQSPSALGPKTKSTTAIARDAIPATVTILALDASGDTIAQGSGFVIRPDGIVLTNWHVLQGASGAIVVLNSGQALESVEFVGGDSIVDLAIIQVSGGGQLPSLQTSSSIPAVGQRVVAIGSPLGLKNSVTEGIVSAVRLLDSTELVQISAPISHGSSGGAVLDNAGRVFAVSTSSIEAGQQLNFAVPVRYALQLLASSHERRGLADVFAQGLSNTGLPTPPPPAVAWRIRSSVAGTYRYELLFRDLITNEKNVGGGVLAGDEEVGASTMAAITHDTMGRTIVLGVDGFLTDAQGHVQFKWMGLSFSGYQTEDGFYAEAHDNSPGTNVAIAINAIERPNNRLDNSGLYRLNFRHYLMTNGTRSSTTNDYAGRAAIATGGGLIWLSLSARDQAGQVWQMQGMGTMGEDGRFVLSLSYPAGGSYHIVGSVLSGVLSGTVTTIYADGTRSEGDLRGERY